MDTITIPLWAYYSFIYISTLFVMIIGISTVYIGRLVLAFIIGFLKSR